MQNKPTNPLEMLVNSVINSAVALVLSWTFFHVWGFNTRWKLATILIFFLVEISCSIVLGKRDIGMLLVKSRWEHEPTIGQYFIYNIFYTASFSVLLFYIWFPMDLMLFNLLCIQLPMILTTGHTLHGYIANIRTIKNPQEGR